MIENAWFVWGVLPLLIFLARILDVSIGTLRILFVVRGSRGIAGVLGFVEVFIWVVVISQIMGEQAGWLHYVMYAAGFAVGNVVGITIESRLGLGLQTIRVITPESTEGLEKALVESGYGATRTEAKGLRGGRMTILFSTLPRRKVAAAMHLIEQHLPRAFLSIEDVRSIKSGHLPMKTETQDALRLIPFGRKGK